MSMARLWSVVLLLALAGGFATWMGILWSNTCYIPEAQLARMAERNEARYGVDRRLILAVVEHESGGNAWARSSVGAMGLMQLMPATAADVKRRYGIEGELTEPEINMQLGSAYLKDLSVMFGGQPDLVIGAYHAGPGNISRWRKRSPELSPQQVIAKHAGPQTRAYVHNVKQSFRARLGK